jgi:DNA-binding NtrC family response regulator
VRGFPVYDFPAMKNSTTPDVTEPTCADVRHGTKPTHRILLVDDDRRSRQSCAQVLILSGYQVDATEDGETGWEALHDNTYDLLITDNKMPTMSGVELLRKMHAARMGLPTIMATGTVPNGEFARNPWLQPAATLVKPFTVDQFLETVKTVLHAADIRREQIDSLPTWRRTVSRWFKVAAVPTAARTAGQRQNL